MGVVIFGPGSPQHGHQDLFDRLDLFCDDPFLLALFSVRVALPTRILDFAPEVGVCGDFVGVISIGVDMNDYL